MNADMLRRNLLELLTTGSTHATLDEILEGLRADDAFRRPPHGPHSVWELLEHMRIAQEDILRYTLDPEWRSPPWPQGYWPEEMPAHRDSAWSSTVERFRRDLEAVKILVSDPRRDLTARIPHGEGRSYLRQVLLVADHNSYHAGQIVQVRRSLGVWSRS